MSCISMLFGIPLTSCGSKNTFGCTNPGLRNSSNDNTRPTTDFVFPNGVGREGRSFDVGVLDIVGESVLVWVCWVPILAVGGASAGGGGGGTGGGGAGGVGAGAGANGLTGDDGLVGLLTLFTHVFAVVVHEFMTAGE